MQLASKFHHITFILLLREPGSLHSSSKTSASLYGAIHQMHTLRCLHNAPALCLCLHLANYQTRSGIYYYPKRNKRVFFNSSGGCLGHPTKNSNLRLSESPESPKGDHKTRQLNELFCVLPYREFLRAQLLRP